MKPKALCSVRAQAQKASNSPSHVLGYPGRGSSEDKTEVRGCLDPEVALASPANGAMGRCGWWRMHSSVIW